MQLSSLQSRLDGVTVGNLADAARLAAHAAVRCSSGKVAPKPLHAAIAGFLAGIMIAAIVIGFLLRRLLKRQSLDPARLMWRQVPRRDPAGHRE